MKPLIHKLAKRLIGELKYWGCEYDFNLPPEFIITEHARQRMIDRGVCKEKKIRKVVVKAWHSEETTLKQWNKQYNRLPHEVYKSFMGYLFIFLIKHNKRLGYTSKTLVTVYDYKVDGRF